MSTGLHPVFFEVKKVSNSLELRRGYEEVVSELSRLVVSSGALTQDDGTGKGVRAESAMDCTLLLEQRRGETASKVRLLRYVV